MTYAFCLNHDEAGTDIRIADCDPRNIKRKFKKDQI